NSGTGAKYRTKKDHMMCKLMCLAIAYSSTIGGLTTLTGTSTNLIFSQQFDLRYPECRCLNFGSWFLFSFPIAVILLLLSWIWLQWLFLGFNFKEMFKCGKTKTLKEKACAEVIKQEYEKLGPMRVDFVVLTAEAIHVNPLHILLPSTLCTSFAFLLPVANPPNAIVFSYGHLKVTDMVKAGLGVNILGVAVVMLGMFTWIEPMFNLHEYPPWATDFLNQTMNMTSTTLLPTSW
ncbi:hypothetical protein STEG23_005366, partial [Scotinomys teguina]